MSNLDLNPLFTNPAGGDFTVGLDSPAIGASCRDGDYLTTPALDYDGLSRTQMEFMCIGAYEVDCGHAPNVKLCTSAAYKFETTAAPHTLDTCLTDDFGTASRNASARAFYAEMVAGFTTFQGYLDRIRILCNAIRALPGLAPIAVMTIAGATTKAKYLSLAVHTNTYDVGFSEGASAMTDAQALAKAAYINAVTIDYGATQKAIETLALHFKTLIDMYASVL